MSLLWQKPRRHSAELQEAGVLKIDRQKLSAHMRYLFPDLLHFFQSLEFCCIFLNFL